MTLILLTKPDRGNPPPAGMISLSLPSPCGLQRGRLQRVTLSEQNGSFLPGAEALADQVNDGPVILPR